MCVLSHIRRLNNISNMCMEEHTCKANSSCCPLRPHTTPFPEEKSILGVIYGVLLWADMNTATRLGAWGRSVMSLGMQANTTP